VLWRAATGRLLLDVPGVARYLVSDGTLVQVDPCAAAPAEDVQRFLQMTPAAALYLQRGIPVLHAAVAADAAGQAVVLAGDSCVGKSVLLAALAQRGWSVLTDDLAPVTLGPDALAVAVPAWPGVITRPGSFAGQPRPISAIWLLGVHNFEPVEVSSVTGIARFEALAAAAYNCRIASALLDRASYLRVAGAVAGSGIPIRRLTRPRRRWTAEELADIIEKNR
jgi:hypothetical protein